VERLLLAVDAQRRQDGPWVQEIQMRHGVRRARGRG
jgi:hypothetical protein